MNIKIIAIWGAALMLPLHALAVESKTTTEICNQQPLTLVMDAAHSSQNRQPGISEGTTSTNLVLTEKSVNSQRELLKNIFVYVASIIVYMLCWLTMPEESNGGH